MPMLQSAILTIMLSAAALLYSSVGHAGASGYLATMALFGVPAAKMKSTALALNILVAGITTTRFAMAGLFSWRVFWPFAVASVPFAYFGGRITIGAAAFHGLLGAVLLYAAWRLTLAQRASDRAPLRPLSAPLALLGGAAIGFVAGAIGVGGGIFLSPLLIFARWTNVRVAAGVSAAFILVNSVAGLLGNLSAVGTLGWELCVWLPAVALGGALGSHLGTRGVSTTTLRRLLAVVLLIAGAKALFRSIYG